VTIRTVSFVVHPGKPRALDLRRELESFVAREGLEVTDDSPDLVLSLGGDGTMLRAAQAAHAADALLLGINLGTLGYLTATDADGARSAVEGVLGGAHETENRMMLACDAGDGASSFVGLNEVLVERASGHRLVRLRVYIGGEGLASFNADGIIVATPTGSTAYALSAGGPIVSPRAECMVVVPVSPHMIFSRPFVLAPDETVEIEVDGDGSSASLSLDGGDGCQIGPGKKVTVRRHPRSLKVVRTGGPDFLERLRTKLGLPG